MLVRFQKPIVVSAGSSILLERTVDLPFTPFPGLIVDSETWGGKVTDLTWDDDEKRLFVLLEEDKQVWHYRLAGASETYLEEKTNEVVQQHLAEGWTRLESGAI